MEKIEGRTALVSGGASGIGLAIAGALVAEGARVVLCDWKERWLRRATEQFGESVIGQHFDVRDRDGWHAAKQAAEKAFGPVEILVNNAGIAPGQFELADMPFEHFDRLIAIMLGGVFNGVRTFAADMRGRGEGHIVNTASLAGLVTNPRMGAYTAAKFAVVGMSEALRAEMAPHGVGVSVLCPGLVRTNIGIEDDGEPPTEERPEMRTGMDPAVVAARVVTAIRDDELHVLTHGGLEERLAARGDEIVRAARTATEWQKSRAD